MWATIPVMVWLASLPPNLYVEILTPNMVVLGRGVLGSDKVLRIEPRGGISALMKETLESSLTFFLPREDPTRVCNPEEGSHLTQLCWHSDPRPPDWGKEVPVAYNTVYGILLEQLEWTKIIPLP